MNSRRDIVRPSSFQSYILKDKAYLLRWGPGGKHIIYKSMKGGVWFCINKTVHNNLTLQRQKFTKSYIYIYIYLCVWRWGPWYNLLDRFWDIYLRINDEDFPFRNADFQIAQLISVSVSKTSIEWISIRRKQSFDILIEDNVMINEDCQTFSDRYMFFRQLYT